MLIIPINELYLPFSQSVSLFMVDDFFPTAFLQFDIYAWTTMTTLGYEKKSCKGN